MKILSFKLIMILVSVSSLFAQNTATDTLGANPFGGDPFGGLSVDSLPSPSQSVDSTTGTASTQAELPPQPPVTSETETPTATESTITTSTEPPPTTTEQALPNLPPQDNTVDKQSQSSFNQIVSADPNSLVQNAIIEGIQITTEKGATPDEKVVSGYFIFRDKPSSYFYEIKLREKKIVFEFNDTKTGASPVPSVSEAPIKGFNIVSDKVDVNKDVKGLKPEYHDVIRVVFDLEGVPQIHVNDEYSIITFSFKWSNNPQMLSKYTIKDKTPKIILWSSVGVGSVGIAALAYFLFKSDESQPEQGEIPIDDLPSRGYLNP